MNSSTDGDPTDHDLTNEDFARLLEFRDGLRRFLRWSEARANEVGLTAPQHQLLLAIRGHGDPPSIGELAEHLLLRHHSAVGLVDRTERAGFVERFADGTDHRMVRVRLTALGDEKLAALTSSHLDELSRLRPQLAALWNRLPEPDG